MCRCVQVARTTDFTVSLQRSCTAGPYVTYMQCKDVASAGGSLQYIVETVTIAEFDDRLCAGGKCSRLLTSNHPITADLCTFRTEEKGKLNHSTVAVKCKQFSRGYNTTVQKTVTNCLFYNNNKQKITLTIVKIHDLFN